MLNLSNLKPKIKKPAKLRRGRGLGSCIGAYSGRGIKGQKARTGGSIRPGFEGGRMPLIRQFPKSRGFRSFKPKSQVVHLSALAERFSAGGKITPQTLQEKGLIAHAKFPVKILGGGKLSGHYEFQGIKFSAKTKQLVEQSGSKIADVS